MAVFDRTVNRNLPIAGQPAPQHVPKIEFTHDGNVVVSCSCGWISNIYFIGELQLAGRDFDHHFEGA